MLFGTNWQNSFDFVLKDQVSPTVTYIGLSQYKNTPTSVDRWLIYRTTNIGSNIITEIADGTERADKIWDNRASYFGSIPQAPSIATYSAIYSSSTATKFTIASAIIPLATSVLLIPANPNRKGFTVYNNSTNSLYVCIENPANAANLIDFCGSNAGPTSVVKWFGPTVPTQAIYVIRNAGVGGVTGWEFT